VLHDALDHLVDGREIVQPTLIAALMNGEPDGFFYAHVKRGHGEDLMFVVDPRGEEQVSLLRGGREGRRVQVISEFRRAEEPEARENVRPDAYRIDATIAKGLDFAANTTVRLTARRAGVRWVRSTYCRICRLIRCGTRTAAR
jgi:hypothetical protein